MGLAIDDDRSSVEDEEVKASSVGCCAIEEDDDIRLSCPHSSGRDGSPVAPITAYRSFGQTIRLTINSGRYTHDLCARQGVATDLSQSEDLQVGIATSMSMADRRRTDWH